MDTFNIIIAVVASVVIITIFPLMELAKGNDEIAELHVQEEVNKTLDETRRTKKLTEDQYNNLVTSISVGTKNAYDIEIEFKILDENAGKKTEQGNATVQGENSYYSVYTAQIVERLGDSKSNNTYYLKDGDIVSISVKNTSPTLYQTLLNSLYKLMGNETYLIYASASGTV